ncbi:MAG: hypothetical protein WCC12_10250 [Anaerolineales bacterium]
MKIGSLREVLVTSAKDLFLFDCRVAGLDARTLSAYRDALDAFVRFTGDIRVGEMTPELVRVYIANLSDGPSEGEEHVRAVIDHYAVIHEWIRWLYAQKFVTRAGSDFDKPPRSLTRRFYFRWWGCGNLPDNFNHGEHRVHRENQKRKTPWAL